MNQKDVQEIANAILQKKKDWLNPDEMEEEFYISKSTQAKMRMNRTIPFHKIGKKYIRYRRQDINQWLEDAKVV